MPWRFWRNWTGRDRTEVILTSFIGFFTLVNAIAMVSYVCTFNKSITEASKQTDKLICGANIQAQAAKDFAKAARDSADAAQQTYRNEQRPIIWVSNLGEPKFFAPSGQIVWTFGFMNYGKTLTKEMRVFKYIKVGSKPLKPGFGAPNPRRGDAPAIPGRQGDFDSIVSNPGSATQEQFDRLLIVGPPNSIEIQVRIEYTDLYGGQYETKFTLTRLNSGSIAYVNEECYIK